jgi:hypothetical protein
VRSIIATGGFGRSEHGPSIDAAYVRAMTSWRHADEGRLMKCLIAVLAAFGAAAVAGIVYGWRNPKAASSAWHHATDAATNATSAAANATSAAANEVKGAVSH